MQTLHSHLPGLCTTVGRAQKRQVGYSQPTVAIGLPVGRRTVKGCGITRLPACSVIVRTNKTAQVDGLLRLGTGRDHQILQPGQCKAVTLGQAAVLNAARRRAEMEIQCAAADLRQPLDCDTQHRCLSLVGHRLQRVQRQRKHRAQRQCRQKQYGAGHCHTGSGQFLVCAVGLQVGSIGGGILATPQPLSLHRPRRRAGPQPAGQKQQPSQNGAACPGQQCKYHDRQQRQPQQQCIGVPGGYCGQKRRDRDRSQQHKQPPLRRDRRSHHRKICVESCIQAQSYGIRALLRTGQKCPLQHKQKHQIPHSQRQHHSTAGSVGQRGAVQRQPHRAQRCRAQPYPNRQRQRKRAVQSRQQTQRQQFQNQQIHCRFQHRARRSPGAGQQHTVNKHQPRVWVGGPAVGHGAQPFYGSLTKVQHLLRRIGFLCHDCPGRVGAIGRAQRLTHGQLAHAGSQLPVYLLQ